MTHDQQILCQYQQGEERGVYLLIQLKTFAPDEETANKVAVQIEEEKKHDRLFAERLNDLDIDCDTMMDALEGIYDLAQDCVDRKDWVQSIAIQAVIEELAMAAFTEQMEKNDDEVTRTTLQEVIEDESKHLQFGMEELKKHKEGNEDRIKELHMKVGEIIIEAFKRNDKQELQALKHTAKKAYGMHKKRLKQIGIKVPGVLEFV